jgi:hypothetical protein
MPLIGALNLSVWKLSRYTVSRNLICSRSATAITWPSLKAAHGNNTGRRTQYVRLQVNKLKDIPFLCYSDVTFKCRRYINVTIKYERSAQSSLDMLRLYYRLRLMRIDHISFQFRTIRTPGAATGKVTFNSPLHASDCQASQARSLSSIISVTPSISENATRQLVPLSHQRSILVHAYLHLHLLFRC